MKCKVRPESFPKQKGTLKLAREPGVWDPNYPVCSLAWTKSQARDENGPQNLGRTAKVHDRGGI